MKPSHPSDPQPDPEILQTALGGRSAPACSPSLKPPKGLKGSEYRNAWNKLNRERCAKADKEYNRRNPEKVKQKWRKNAKRCHSKSLAEHGVARTTHESRKSEKKATMAFERWGPVEDDILMSSEITERELADKLGRSIRAVQRRKWRLRQDDSLENSIVKPRA